MLKHKFRRTISLPVNLVVKWNLITNKNTRSTRKTYKRQKLHKLVKEISLNCRECLLKVNKLVNIV